MDPIGKAVMIARQYPVTVTAVIRDNPSNTNLAFSALLSWNAYLQQKPWVKDMAWDNYAYSTYVLLRPGATAVSINEKIKGLIG